MSIVILNLFQDLSRDYYIKDADLPAGRQEQFSMTVSN
jgi:hypothetical protein